MKSKGQEAEKGMLFSKLSLKNLDQCVELDDISRKGLWSRRQWEQELTNPSNLNLGLFHWEELITFACGMIIVDELNLTSIAVQPSHRNKGLGTITLTKLLHQAKRLGAKSATLEEKENNLVAISLYQKCGFQTTGHRKNYYKDGSAALIKWKSLTSLS